MKGPVDETKKSIEEATASWEPLDPYVLDSLAMSLVNRIETAIKVGR